jgi:hypothetical protein
MRYELTESAGQWIVICDGLEVSRFFHLDRALEDVSGRLRRLSPQQRAALAVRFEKPVGNAA